MSTMTTPLKLKKGDRILVKYNGWTDVLKDEILILCSKQRSGSWTADIFSKGKLRRAAGHLEQWWYEDTLNNHIKLGYMELLPLDTDSIEPSDYYDRDNIILD